MNPDQKEVLRYQFAGQALQGIIIAASVGTKIEWHAAADRTPELLFCESAVRIADALLAALEGEP